MSNISISLSYNCRRQFYASDVIIRSGTKIVRTSLLDYIRINLLFCLNSSLSEGRKYKVLIQTGIQLEAECFQIEFYLLEELLTICVWRPMNLILSSCLPAFLKSSTCSIEAISSKLVPNLPRS